MLIPSKKSEGRYVLCHVSSEAIASFSLEDLPPFLCLIGIVPASAMYSPFSSDWFLMLRDSEILTPRYLFPSPLLLNLPFMSFGSRV